MDTHGRNVAALSVQASPPNTGLGRKFVARVAGRMASSGFLGPAPWHGKGRPGRHLSHPTNKLPFTTPQNHMPLSNLPTLQSLLLSRRLALSVWPAPRWWPPAVAATATTARRPRWPASPRRPRWPCWRPRICTSMCAAMTISSWPRMPPTASSARPRWCVRRARSLPIRCWWTTATPSRARPWPTTRPRWPRSPHAAAVHVQGHGRAGLRCGHAGQP